MIVSRGRAARSFDRKDTPNNNCYEFAECRGLIV